MMAAIKAPFIQRPNAYHIYHTNKSWYVDYQQLNVDISNEREHTR
jgi:hypothetical protein